MRRIITPINLCSYGIIAFGISLVLVASREGEAFTEMHRRFCRIAVSCADEINSLKNEPVATKRYMRTSCTKIIDNAIAGYGLTRLNLPEGEEG